MNDKKKGMERFNAVMSMMDITKISSRYYNDSKPRLTGCGLNQKELIADLVRHYAGIR